MLPELQGRFKQDGASPVADPDRPAKRRRNSDRVPVAASSGEVLIQGRARSTSGEATVTEPSLLSQDGTRREHHRAAMQGWAQALRTSEALGILLGGVVTSESQINQADFQNKTRTLLTALQQNLREIEEQHTNSERGDGQVCPSPISPFFFPSHFFLAETLLPSVPFFLLLPLPPSLSPSLLFFILSLLTYSGNLLRVPVTAARLR